MNAAMVDGSDAPAALRPRTFTKEQRDRWNGRALEKARAARSAYRSGAYLIGSYHRETVCEGCGKTFPMWRTGEQMRFCSRQCAGSDRGRSTIEIMALRLRRAEAVTIRDQIASAKMLKRALLAADRAMARTCLQCGRSFVRLAASRYCSDTCRSEHGDHKDRTPRPCPGCGIIFAPVRGSHARKFCSRTCGDKECKRRLNHRRRARKRSAVTEFVNPTLVFIRDSWRCYLCGCDTPQLLQGSLRPSAPTVDHVIPLAAGGPHVYGNLRCACRQCNSIKSDRIVNTINDIGDGLSVWALTPPRNRVVQPCAVRQNRHSEF